MIRMRSLPAALAAAAFLLPPALSQGPPPPPGQQLPPAVQARMKAWQKFRETHKNVEALQQTLAGLEEMEKTPATRLTKAQAKTVVGVLNAWRSKPVMTDAQAQKVNKQITGPLTVAQLKKIATAPGARGMGAGQRPGGGSGARPNSGARRAPDLSRFPAPKEYNPLNPKTLPMEGMRTRATQRLDALTKTLTARAK